MPVPTKGAFTSLVASVTEHADLVVIDHRGGSGVPIRNCRPCRSRNPCPLTVGWGSRSAKSTIGVFFCRQIDYWGRAGADLRLHLRTPQLARDIEMILLALGYDKIRLGGMSNGTYRIREYLRQFHQRVDSALLFISHGYQRSCPSRNLSKRRVVAHHDAAVAAGS